MKIEDIGLKGFKVVTEVEKLKLADAIILALAVGLTTLKPELAGP